MAYDVRRTITVLSLLVPQTTSLGTGRRRWWGGGRAFRSGGAARNGGIAEKGGGGASGGGSRCGCCDGNVATAEPRGSVAPHRRRWGGCCANVSVLRFQKGFELDLPIFSTCWLFYFQIPTAHVNFWRQCYHLTGWFYHCVINSWNFLPFDWLI